MQALRPELKKAALKRRKTKDSYKILAVSRDCSKSTAEKEYRSKHPDKAVSVYICRPFLLVSFNSSRAAVKKNSNS